MFRNVSSWALIYSSNVSPLSFPPLPKNFSLLLKQVLTSRLQLSQNPQGAKQATLLYKVQQVQWCALSQPLCSGWVVKSVHYPSAAGFIWHCYKMQIYQVLVVGSLFLSLPSAESRVDKVSAFFQGINIAHPMPEMLLASFSWAGCYHFVLYCRYSLS